MVASEAEEDVPKNSASLPKTMPVPEKISKRFYRRDAWMTMQKRSQDPAGPSNHINRKIPYFPEADLCAERLAQTNEFKDAKSIKVNIDLAQEAVKLQALKAGKTLFVAPSQKSDYLYAKIKPCNVDEVPLAEQKRIVKMLAGEETYEELGIDQAEPLDMIVVGCVAVTEAGQRIGKGNGYVDLEIGILVDLGVIRPHTVIATTVADEQVYGPLPDNLFTYVDFSIDLIVTPTRILRPTRPEMRAAGIQWGLLSSRRLEVVRVLKKLKERLEAQGQDIELKGEDTDVEIYRKPHGDGQRRQQNRRRRGGFGRGGGGGGGAEGAEGGEQKQGGGKQQRGGDGNGQAGGGSGGGGGGDREHQRSGDGGAEDGGQRRRRAPQHHLGGVRIRVSNMYSVRFKDFKEELRARDCYPCKISKGRYGKCLLIFSKRGEGGPEDEQQQAEGLLQKLADMRITVLPEKEGDEPKQVELKCELEPPKQSNQPGDVDGGGNPEEGSQQQQQQQQSGDDGANSSGGRPQVPPQTADVDSPLKEPAGGGSGGQNLVY
ncbi:methenyltetrahydrofolate synthase domain-containing protein [Anopheles ziemanni]|uniref:methenyltetrahydrofolate synthase domain-containing protein n=1 Tax=Anopheles ziemanni TaxID=345580 RepID=UPI00265E62B0|nr:methenyltetrahydrofolate synthase domain-containing protein [Anopheles ziemanni]